MGKAVRAIIIENNQMLVMHRNKHGSQYYTLIGGQVKEDETLEEALKREVMEETGLTVTAARPMYFEQHAAPYNEQYIFLCEIAPHGEIQVQHDSEEGFMNRLDMNVHTPMWISTKGFERLDFRTPQLQTALIHAFKKGFPPQVVKL